MNPIEILLILCGLVFTPLFIIFAVKNGKYAKTINKYKHELDRLLASGIISQQDYYNCVRYISAQESVTTYYRPPMNPNMYPPRPPYPPYNMNQGPNNRPLVNQQPMVQNIPAMPNQPNPNVVPPQIQQMPQPPRPVQMPPQQNYPQPAYIPQPQPMYNNPQPQQVYNRPQQYTAPKVSNENFKTSLIFIIGVSLVFLAGIIFSTTTWDTLNSISKTLIIFSVSAIFFCVSIIAEKALQLNKTSTAFFILGSVFLPLTVICAGYFEIFGDWLSLYGDGKWTLFALSLTILGIFSFIGSGKYKITVFPWIYLSCITLTLLCILKQFDLPGDIFAICIAVYSTVLILVLDFSEVIKENTSLAKTLKIFAIINTGLLAFISIFITTDGVIALIPLVVFSFILLHPMFIYSDYSFGVYPYGFLMLTGLYKLIAPRKVSDFLIPIVLLALVSTIASLTGFLKQPVKKGLKYISIVTTPLALALSLGVFAFSRKWDLTSLICLLVLIADMSWIAFKDKIRLALYAQTTMLFIFLEGLSLFILPEEPLSLVLFTLFTFAAFVIYRCCDKLRTLASDLLFSLTGLVCWLISVIQVQAQDSELALTSLICIIVFVICAVILAFGKNKVLSTIFCWTIPIAPVFVATSIYQLTKIDFNAATSFSVSFFPCALVISALAVLSTLFYKESGFMLKISLPSFISSLSVTGILFIREIFVDTHRMPYLWIAAIVLLFKSIDFYKDSKKAAYSTTTLLALTLSNIAVIISLFNYDLSTINVLLFASYLPLLTFIVYFAVKKFMSKDLRLLALFTGLAESAFGIILFIINACDHNFIGYNIYIIGLCAIAYYAFSISKINFYGVLPLLYLPYTIKQIITELTDSNGMITFCMLILLLGFILIGRLIYKALITKDEGHYIIDWFTFASILSAFLIPLNKHFACLFFIFVAIYLTGFIKRQPTWKCDKWMALSAGFALSVAFWVQQFIDIPDYMQAEVFFIPFVLMCALTILMWKDQKELTWTITFYVALFITVVLGILAMLSGELFDAMFIVCTMLIIILISFAQKSLRWFILSTSTLIIITFYLTRDFWVSIQWWVYLLTAGIILLCMAAAHEMRKQKGITKQEFKLSRIFSLFEYFKK